MAERFNFTKAQLDGLPDAAPGKRDYYHDAGGPQSIGGLLLLVTPTGTKSFQVYRKVAGKPVRVTLGRYPDMTIEQARRKAKAALSAMAEGINPNAAEKATRARGITLGEVYADYLQARKTLKPGSLEAYRHVMNDLKDWQRKPLGDITRDMVVNRHSRIGERSEARANLAMRLLRALFNFAAGKYRDGDKSLFPDNPVRQISHDKAWFSVERRETVIKPHELRPWYEAVTGLPDTHPGERSETIRDYLLLLLFTGLRKVEGASLQWSDVDLIGRTLTARRTKNGRDHTLPLSDFLHDLLTRRRAQAAPGDRYVFASDTNRSGHVRDIQRQINRITARSEVAFTLHDLRRTFLTAAERLDISVYAIKRLANHKSSDDDVTGGYIITSVERLRKPMQAITDFLLSAIGLRPRGEVVTLPRPTQEQAG